VENKVWEKTINSGKRNDSGVKRPQSSPFQTPPEPETMSGEKGADGVGADLQRTLKKNARKEKKTVSGAAIHSPGDLPSQHNTEAKNKDPSLLRTRGLDSGQTGLTGKKAKENGEEREIRLQLLLKQKQEPITFTGGGLKKIGG